MEHHLHHGPNGGPPRREKRERSLAEISVTVWLTAENASFACKNGLLFVTYGGEEKRAFLSRQFPFDFLWEFISVLDEEQAEIGIIRRLSDFEGEAYALLRTELEHRYFAPTVIRILSVKERYGFSYWKVVTEEGNVSFTLHDTFRSIIRAGEHRLIFMDVNGNRFELPDVEKLDRKSYKKIELYL
ncbi:MAG: DUF1854 domain-containing protein [Ruminococcaceae bacterium]|nr:DUF1854 domain-containing protein [Oscillospiraceae bacterium]